MSRSRISRTVFPQVSNPRGPRPKLLRPGPSGWTAEALPSSLRFPQDGPTEPLAGRTPHKAHLSEQPLPMLGALRPRRLRLPAPISLPQRELALIHSRVPALREPLACRARDTHRALRLLLAAGRPVGGLRGGRRPVVQAGEGVPAGRGRAPATASARRRRERAKEQPGRQSGAAGRRLGLLAG